LITCTEFQISKFSSTGEIPLSKISLENVSAEDKVVDEECLKNINKIIQNYKDEVEKGGNNGDKSSNANNSVAPNINNKKLLNEIDPSKITNLTNSLSSKLVAGNLLGF
jgi:hypothetical protein